MDARPGHPAPRRERRRWTHMLDVIYIAALFALIGVVALVARGVERL
ncbi:hypothetical protein G7070_14500 [Propioniciclava coleopterorum]|uniref:Uncharacterized protein n=1 Tax=Propioniciclava coleopterorum TaxID=2714937 RepID=A0A6G7Y9F6_9ACTN|nr:hypothetical protein [Propioniciclava coleopterorum]QIK73247.1 hypothetical protein G7070_14500 [Propioniciclava coleopterorum]